jgi:hypothetical protein
MLETDSYEPEPSADESLEIMHSRTHSYENLILLCPTCHRKVDKAPPGVYPEEMLHRWKSQHEATVRAAGATLRFENAAELKGYVSRLLVKNRLIWSQFGPECPIARNDPGSNLHTLWGFRNLDTIVPNNTNIVNALTANERLLSTEERDAFLRFKLHAQEFEANQYIRIDNYPCFPTDFGRMFGE